MRLARFHPFVVLLVVAAQADSENGILDGSTIQEFEEASTSTDQVIKGTMPHMAITPKASEAHSEGSHLEEKLTVSKSDSEDQASAASVLGAVKELTKDQPTAAIVLGESSSETSEERTRLASTVPYVPAADSNAGHCNDANAAMEDPAYCARVADTSLDITGALSYSAAANCPDDGISSKGFLITGDSATGGDWDVPSCQGWSGWGGRLSLSKCSILDSGETICTKGAVEHPHATGIGVGILVYKRVRCVASGRCFVHKAGICLDLEDACATTFTEDQCLVAAKIALPVGKTLGSTALSTGSWAHVPAGCSVQSGGNWAAHYNTNNAGVDTAGIYSTVCGDPRAVCSAAAQSAVPAEKIHSLPQLERGSWGHVPAGCSVQSGNNWGAYYNTNNAGVDTASMYTAVTISAENCLAAAKMYVPVAATQGRTALSTGSWAHVPAGCSVQSGGDWAAHYNTNNAGVDTASMYTTVDFSRPRLKPKHTYDWGHMNAMPNADTDKKKAFAEQAVLTVEDLEKKSIPLPVCSASSDLWAKLADLRILAH
jgi:hypothetical protein